MRRILTAITAAALAFSLVAQTGPVAAAEGYDSTYAGESAFLSLALGDLGTFTVFFVNAGTTTWARDTTTQVDLAVCLENKTTCDVSSPTTIDFDNNWLSTTRYTTHTQTSVAPGQAATFTYSVRVPASAADGTYTFNGALVVSATGADVHNEGYYQAATVAALTQSAEISSLDPEEGSVQGDENVVIRGEGILCSPSPTVKFGSEKASVLSCGETALTVVTPEAAEAGDVDVTVTNSKASASNALTFTYLDDVAPTFDSISIESQTVTLTFSEPVCASGTLTDPAGISIKVNGSQADWDEDSITVKDCADDSTADTFTLQVDAADVNVVQGDNVSVTVTTDGADSVEDAAGNTMEKARTRTAEAAADESPPTISTAEATDDDRLVVTWDEGVDCGDGDAADAFKFKPDGGSSVTATNASCDGSDEITLTFAASTFDTDTEGTLTYDPDDIDDADRVEDASGNPAEGTSVVITPLAAPIITDAEATETSGFTAVSADVIVLAFDMEMNDDNTRDMQLLITDDDGTRVVIACGGLVDDDTDGIVSADCDWNADDDSVEITLRENTNEDDDMVASGDFKGIQWPATIEDAVGWTSIGDVELDVDASTDVEIEK